MARLLSWPVRLTQAGFAAIVRAYVPALAWSLQHRGRVLLISLTVLLATAALVPRLGSELIPQLSQGEFIADLRLAPGTPLEQTDRAIAAAQNYAMELPEVALTYAVTGTGNRLDASPTDAGENTGRLSVGLKPETSPDDEPAVIGALRGKFDDLAGVQYQFSRPALFSFASPLEVTITGYELERLRAVAEQVRLGMQASPTFSDIKSTVEAGNPEIQIIFDQERAAQLGITVREFADRVVSSVRGNVATRYKLRDKKIDVLVRSVDTRASSIEEIRSLIVNPGSARPVPLTAVADVIVATGPATAFAAIAGRLGEQPPETEFDRGLRRFSYLLTGTMLALVTVVFAVHVLNGRPVLDTLLFAVALAVGLSPELLPAILSINLARGASLMAKEGVLVRHLSAIENLGSMDVLCTDKTGTLTEGVVELSGAFDATGVDSPEVLELASWNAALATGLVSPLDEALLSTHRPTTAGLRKIAELPFDFERKRVSVLVEDGIGQRLVTKGAFEPILSVCTQLAGGTPLDSSARSALRAQFEAWSRDGIRVVAVAERRLSVGEVLERGAEHDLAFRGFLTFLDRPKKGVREAIADLAHLGVTVKVISGDNLLVTRHIAGMVGLSVDTALTGRELATMDDITLAGRLEAADIFAEVDPGQKERIIGALRRRGHVVGFLGDGVNDAPAMHAADTSLSVQTAVDVAREAADFVLLEQDLDVIRAGIEEGRRTVANTLKYIRATMSANLGNMLSMAAASLILPFLPLLASQILLNNFLSDIPAFGIAEDSVDPELVETPPRWDVAALGRFMLVFGLVSSAFDFLTFGVLLRLFHAGPALFRTGWFVESLLTELAVALIVRTRRPFYQSRPGALLFGASVVLMVVTFAIPYLPLSQLIGFTPLPAPLVLVIVAITLLYVMATEGTKRLYYARGKA